MLLSSSVLAFSSILLFLVYLLHEECGHGLETFHKLASRLWARRGFEMGDEMGEKMVRSRGASLAGQGC